MFRMKRARELLDGVHHSRRGAIDGVADDHDVAVPHRVEISPAGPRCAARRCRAACLRRARWQRPELPAASRTISSRLTCGHSASVSTTERPPARRNASAINVSRPTEIKRVGPDNEKHAARRGAGKPAVEIGEPAREDLPASAAADFSSAQRAARDVPPKRSSHPRNEDR